MKLVIWNGPFEWFDCFCNTPNLDDNDLKRGIWSVTFDCIWCVCVCVYIYIYIYVKTKTFLKTQRECLICIFKQQFLFFKQHFTYFHTLFHLHVFSQMFANNNFQFLNTWTKQVQNIYIKKKDLQAYFIFLFLFLLRIKRESYTLQT